jgi:hypothetical protein
MAAHFVAITGASSLFTGSRVFSEWQKSAKYWKGQRLEKGRVGVNFTKLVYIAHCILNKAVSAKGT